MDFFEHVFLYIIDMIIVSCHSFWIVSSIAIIMFIWRTWYRFASDWTGRTFWNFIE